MSQNVPGSAPVDGQASFFGGANYGTLPTLISADQYWTGVNVDPRGGGLRTRPGWVKRGLIYPNETAENQFITGNPQGMKFYQSAGKGYLISSIDGRIFPIDVTDNFRLQDATPATGPNARDEPKAYMQQAGDYFVIQDGSSKPILLNGLTPSRATDSQVPVGTAMAEGWGRLWVANGNQFIAGDIDDGGAGIITFTDQDYLTGGGAFKLPTFMGQLNGMAFIPLQDTATGQGQLLVGGDFGVASINGGIPRDQWQTVQLQQVALLDIGWVGQDSNALLNGDIFYRSYDGIRSYRMARAQQGINGNTPQSNEVHPYVASDTQQYLKYGSAVYFDGRILMTTAPVFSGTYCSHKGLLVLDSEPQTSIREKLPPMWDGLWDGLNIVQITKGIFNKQERCFALVRQIDSEIYGKVNAVDGDEITVQNPENFEVDEIYMIQNAGYYKVTDITGSVLTIEPIRTADSIQVDSSITGGEYNEVWELTKDSPFDVSDGVNHPINCKLWTKSFTHTNPMALKELSFGEIWVDDVVGEVSWSVKFRPDQYPCMFDWTEGTVCSEYQACNIGCPSFLTRHPTYKPQFRFAAPNAVCNDVTGMKSTLGYEFQWLLEWSGHWRIRVIKSMAIDRPESNKATC